MIAELTDYYELMGIPRQASREEIRKAFRKLARQFHPDLAANKSVAEERFKKINEAYEVLGDPDNRQKYDRGPGRWQRFAGFGPRHVRPQNGKSHREGWSEDFRPYTERPEFRGFYEDFLGARRDRSNGFSTDGEDSTPKDYWNSRRRKACPRRGEDIHGDILISLGEVLHGSIHTVSVLRTNPLTGEAERHPLHVKIVPGVRDGQILRLHGRGDYGVDGGEPGDLSLRVKIVDHPTLRVRGADLYYDLELNPWDAFFGAKKPLPTLEGTVSVKVPSGTTSGQRLRLRGKGLPTGEGTRGDLYAVVSIKVRFGEIAKRVFRRR